MSARKAKTYAKWIAEYDSDFLMQNSHSPEEQLCAFALSESPICNGGYMLTLSFVNLDGAITGLRNLIERKILWESSGIFFANHKVDRHEIDALYRDYCTSFPSLPTISKPADNEPCSVYVLDNSFHRKVGISNDVKKRVAQLQTASSMPIVTVHTQLMVRSEARLIERKLHKIYSPENTSGEWFDAPADKIIASLVEMGGQL